MSGLVMAEFGVAVAFLVGWALADILNRVVGNSYQLLRLASASILGTACGYGLGMAISKYRMLTREAGYERLDPILLSLITLAGAAGGGTRFLCESNVAVPKWQLTLTGVIFVAVTTLTFLHMITLLEARERILVAAFCGVAVVAAAAVVSVTLRTFKV